VLILDEELNGGAAQAIVAPTPVMRKA